MTFDTGLLGTHVVVSAALQDFEVPRMQFFEMPDGSGIGMIDLCNTELRVTFKNSPEVNFFGQISSIQRSVDESHRYFICLAGEHHNVVCSIAKGGPFAPRRYALHIQFAEMKALHVFFDCNTG